MCRLRCGGVASPVVLALLAAGAVLGGCANSPVPHPGAVMSRVEADGLPSQIHPAADIRRQPDDPTEPFSPNYGMHALEPPASAPGRLSPAQEEAIVAAAITAHEMRKP